MNGDSVEILSKCIFIKIMLHIFEVQQVPDHMFQRGNLRQFVSRKSKHKRRGSALITIGLVYIRLNVRTTEGIKF